jgi:Flp pilus assembly protein TadG
MRRIVAKRQGRQNGNALVEFSLIAVVLFLLSCGVADFARSITAVNIAQEAADAGTMYGALSPAHYNDLTGCQNAALANTTAYSGVTATATQFCACSVGGAHVTCPATCSTGSAETYLQLQVTIPYASMFKYPFIPDPLNLTGLSVVRLQ